MQGEKEVTGKTIYKLRKKNPNKQRQLSPQQLQRIQEEMAVAEDNEQGVEEQLILAEGFRNNRGSPMRDNARGRTIKTADMQSKCFRKINITVARKHLPSSSSQPILPPYHFQQKFRTSKTR